MRWPPKAGDSRSGRHARRAHSIPSMACVIFASLFQARVIGRAFERLAAESRPMKVAILGRLSRSVFLGALRLGDNVQRMFSAL